MMMDKQLFDRFLRNECNAEERKLVLEYLDAHPEIIADYLSEEEFSTIGLMSRDEALTDRSFRSIQQRIKGRSFSLVKLAAMAAAAVILVVGIKWLSPASKNKPSGQTGSRETAAKEEWLTERNVYASVRTFTLPDGSTAELTPGSQIAYHPSFTRESRRLVRLEGEGQFSVAGDEEHPFTVISGELATTVLGTYFSVAADPGSPTIKVRLYTGKVRIETTGSVKWKTKDPVLYLQPGDELTYNRQQMEAFVRSQKNIRRENQSAVTAGRSPQSKQSQQLVPSQKPDWYRFGGQPLTEVFDQLSDYYGVQINYFPSDVANRYFTGKFSKNDSLEAILKDISLLHGLTLKKVDGMYVFRKTER